MASEAIACSDAKLEDFLERSRTLTVNHLPAPQDPDVETAARIVSCDHKNRNHLAIANTGNYKIFLGHCGMSMRKLHFSHRGENEESKVPECQRGHNSCRKFVVVHF